MSLYVIGDLHLSFGVHKPMDVFGGWENHVSILKAAWLREISAEDTVVLAGDTSWGMTFAEALPDFQWIDALPGRKIILKGNHDYWWSTAAKFYKFCEEHSFSNQFILNNNFYEYEDWAICGTRGWFFEEERSGQHDEKVFRRELIRLELSLSSARKLQAKKLVVMMHYPPLADGGGETKVSRLLSQYEADDVVYGHLHGASLYKTARLQMIIPSVFHSMLPHSYRDGASRIHW